MFLFASMWFLGVFTSLLVFPDHYYPITIYWINGSITIASLLSLHLWLMNANMYNKKNGQYLKLLFLPGLLMLATIPIDSWMLRGDEISTTEFMFIPGPGLYLLWLIQFSYLIVNLILTRIEMKKGNEAAKLWFKGITLFFVWTLSTLVGGLILQDTNFYFIAYFIPHGALFWMYTIYLSMSKYDYLSSYENRYNILFEKSPLGILILDENATVLEASPLMSKYIGVERQELINSSILAFVDGIDNEDFLESHHYYYENQIKLSNKELTFVNKLGESITILVDSDFIMTEGQLLQFVMVKDITEAKVKEKRVKYLAYHDILTDLLNRAGFEKHISELLSDKEKFDFVLLDLNKMKQINDTHGHQAGDQAIQHVASLLRKVMNDNHPVARLGGDEFVLLLDPNKTGDVIKKVRSQFDTPLKLANNQQIFLSASIGVSHYPSDGENMDQLYSVADKRMYKDKEQTKEK